MQYDTIITCENLNKKKWTFGTCQKLAGGREWKQREGHNFLRLRKGRGHEKWAVERGRVMQIYARDHPRKQRKFFIW